MSKATVVLDSEDLPHVKKREQGTRRAFVVAVPVAVAMPMVLALGRMGFAMVLMAMAPEHQFFQDEKQRDATEQRDPDGAVSGRTGQLDGFRQQPEQRRRQHRAGGKGHQHGQ
jgi:hypothetical protein